MKPLFHSRKLSLIKLNVHAQNIGLNFNLSFTLMSQENILKNHSHKKRNDLSVSYDFGKIKTRTQLSLHKPLILRYNQKSFNMLL